MELKTILSEMPYSIYTVALKIRIFTNFLSTGKFGKNGNTRFNDKLNINNKFDCSINTMRVVSHQIQNKENSVFTMILRWITHNF